MQFILRCKKDAYRELSVKDEDTRLKGFTFKDFDIYFLIIPGNFPSSRR